MITLGQASSEIPAAVMHKVTEPNLKSYCFSGVVLFFLGDNWRLPRAYGARNDEQKLNEKSLGNVLLSQGAAPQVPSALMSLTAGFGMLPGVPSSLESPRDIFLCSLG